MLRRDAEDREHFRRFVLKHRHQRGRRVPGIAQVPPNDNRLAVAVLPHRISYRQFPKSHRSRLHWRVLRVCVLWFLRDVRNPTGTARGHERSAVPAREWLVAAAVIRCTWHSRRSRFTAAKPLPSTSWRRDGAERFQGGARETWSARKIKKRNVGQSVTLSAGEMAVRDRGRSGVVAIGASRRSTTGLPA